MMVDVFKSVPYKDDCIHYKYIDFLLDIKLITLKLLKIKTIKDFTAALNEFYLNNKLHTSFFLSMTYRHDYIMDSMKMFCFFFNLKNMPSNEM